MRISPVGLTLDQLDSPALLLDMDAFEHNASKMAQHLAERNVQWRPHAKAFKCPAIAHRLKRFGAIGVTVAKVSEAEVMAAGGVDDILIANLVVGPLKAARLAGLQRLANVKATVEHRDHIAPLGEAARKLGVEIGLLVDVDLGMHRTGVASPEIAVALAREIHETPGLRLDGVMGYEGHTLMIEDPAEKRAAIGRALGILIEARDAIKAAGLPCPIVSAGGTGSYQFSADVPGLTEIQAGGGIFACRYYTEACRVGGHRPALTILATVVSRPVPNRIVLDIGQKSISAYRQDPTIAEVPGARLIGLSAEHANYEIPPDSAIQIGAKVMVTPGYSDFTFVLHDRVLGHRGGIVESTWELLGRGMLQ